MFTLQMQAKVLDVSYKVNFGILGQMGISDAHLETKGDKYTINIKIKATSLAKTLSKNRKERHISKGHIVNGMYISDSYSIFKNYSDKRSEKTYIIDHTRKRVMMMHKKYKKGKLVKDKTSKLDYYSKNDLLTLYFNIVKLIKDKRRVGTYRFTAVGAERQKGTVKVYIPKDKELKGYKKTLGEGDYWYMTAIIYQKIFASNKGELMLAVGKDGVAEKAVLKDLIMFGDLVAERIK